MQISGRTLLRLEKPHYRADDGVYDRRQRGRAEHGADEGDDDGFGVHDFLLFRVIRSARSIRKYPSADLLVDCRNYRRCIRAYRRQTDVLLSSGRYRDGISAASKM